MRIEVSLLPTMSGKVDPVSLKERLAKKRPRNFKTNELEIRRTEQTAAC